MEITIIIGNCKLHFEKNLEIEMGRKGSRLVAEAWGMRD